MDKRIEEPNVIFDRRKNDERILQLLTEIMIENRHRDARIANLESDHEVLTEMATALQVMATEMQHLAKSNENLADRMTNIESKPAKRWETVVGATIGAITGYVASHFLK